MTIGVVQQGQRRRIRAVLGVGDRVEIPWQVLRAEGDGACGCVLRCVHEPRD